MKPPIEYRPTKRRLKLKGGDASARSDTVGATDRPRTDTQPQSGEGSPAGADPLEAGFEDGPSVEKEVLETKPVETGTVVKSKGGRPRTGFDKAEYQRKYMADWPFAKVAGLTVRQWRAKQRGKE